jgi:hypothetical protein
MTEDVNQKQQKKEQTEILDIYKNYCRNLNLLVRIIAISELEFGGNPKTLQNSIDSLEKKYLNVGQKPPLAQHEFILTDFEGELISDFTLETALDSISFVASNFSKYSKTPEQIKLINKLRLQSREDKFRKLSEEKKLEFCLETQELLTELLQLSTEEEEKETVNALKDFANKEADQNLQTSVQERFEKEYNINSVYEHLLFCLKGLLDHQNKYEFPLEPKISSLEATAVFEPTALSDFYAFKKELQKTLAYISDPKNSNSIPYKLPDWASGNKKDPEKWWMTKSIIVKRPDKPKDDQFFCKKKMFVQALNMKDTTRTGYILTMESRIRQIDAEISDLCTINKNLLNQLEEYTKNPQAWRDSTREQKLKIIDYFFGLSDSGTFALIDKFSTALGLYKCRNEVIKAVKEIKRYEQKRNQKKEEKPEERERKIEILEILPKKPSASEKKVEEKTSKSTLLPKPQRFSGA